MWTVSFPLIITILFLALQDVYSENEKKAKEFIPTHDWQIVEKGQKIPKGLHIRVNFATGKTEAKMLNEKEKPNKENALVEMPVDYETESLLDTEVIKEALKKIKNDEYTEHKDYRKTSNFRSYEQIKEDLSDLNLTAKVDTEVVKELFDQYKREIEKINLNEHAILRILEDFDFLAHQFDNGLEFVRQNGFNVIIYRNLNLTSDKIKEETLKLFGSLVQNNAKVQIHALETGSIPIILRTLNLESSSQVKSRGVFALSCLLRRFPLAQFHFIQNGGLFIVTKLLTEEYPLKIQVKLVTLMNDLLLENLHALKGTSEENRNILIGQYKLVNLENLLLEQNWCKFLNKLLVTIVTTDPENHDIIDKCLTSMHTIAKKCIGSFHEELLLKLKKRYEILSKENLEESGSDNSDFFSNIYKLCSEILHLVNIKTEL
nr:nucleotide exchange factor SIL1 [Leptinotarsa decemlineata]